MSEQLHAGFGSSTASSLSVATPLRAFRHYLQREAVLAEIEASKGFDVAVEAFEAEARFADHVLGNTAPQARSTYAAGSGELPECSAGVTAERLGCHSELCTCRWQESCYVRLQMSPLSAGNATGEGGGHPGLEGMVNVGICDSAIWWLALQSFSIFLLVLVGMMIFQYAYRRRAIIMAALRDEEDSQDTVRANRKPVAKGKPRISTRALVKDKPKPASAPTPSGSAAEVAPEVATGRAPEIVSITSGPNSMRGPPSIKSGKSGSPSIKSGKSGRSARSARSGRSVSTEKQLSWADGGGEKRTKSESGHLRAPRKDDRPRSTERRTASSSSRSDWRPQ